MPDREKVINALECGYCNFPKQMDCKNCPYEKICYHDKACSLMLRDALALLKKQEPMEPITDKWRNYVCPVCGEVSVFIEDPETLFNEEG